MDKQDELEERQTRAALNESRFRELNEGIEERDAGGAVFTEFRCECPLRSCELTVPLAVEEYEEVRAVPTHFVVAPGHVVPDFEVVVRVTPRYEVVEKIGVAAKVSTQLDPRSQRRP
jgi:hypothetical protein